MKKLIGPLADRLRKIAPVIGAVGLFYWLSQEDDEMKICFLDVGDGHCTHIRLPNGEDMLIDCFNNNGHTNIIEYLKNQRIGNIEYLVVTHPHMDHFKGITELYNEIGIDNVLHVDYKYMPEEFRSEEEKQEFENYYEIVRQCGQPVWNGNTFEIGDVSFSALNPTKEFVRSLGNNPNFEQINNSSIVLYFRYCNNKILIPGDNHTNGWNEILERWDFSELDLMLASHHGQKSGFNAELLKQTSPHHVVFSSGSRKEYDAYENYYHYAEKIHTTRSSGDISFNCKC